ncbi:hypothetical protein D3C73_1345430 [compost metagenome]
MAEQLAFHEFSRERRAVDGDAGLLRALAPAVNRLGQLTFTGAGLTENQDVGIGIGYLAGGLEHDFHRWAM